MSDKVANLDASHRAMSFIQLLGLNADPFADGVNNKSYYQSDESLDNQNLVTSLVENTRQMSVIVGAPGSGKTTFLARLAQCLQNGPAVLPAQTGVYFQLESLRSAISACLAIESDSQKSLVARLVADNVPRVLLIDDAHDLSASCLDLLVTLNEESNGLLRPILLANPSINKYLNQRQSRIIPGGNAHILHLRPLSQVQTAAYIENRLHAVGLCIPFSLTDVDLSSIYRDSGGLPGEINIKAKRLFISRQFIIGLSRMLGNEVETKILIPRLRWVSGLIAVLISVGLVAGLGWGVYTHFMDNRPVERVVKSEKATLNGTLKKPENLIPSRPQEKSTGKTVLVIKKPVTQKIVVIKGKAQLLSVAKSKKRKTLTPPALIKSNVKASLGNRRWVMDQEPSYFTIQLLSVRKKRTIKRYVNTHRLAQRTGNYKVSFKGKQWQVLVYGVFRTKSEAKAHLRKLPDDVRRDRPMVRNLYYVQREAKNRVIVRANARL